MAPAGKAKMLGAISFESIFLWWRKP